MNVGPGQHRFSFSLFQNERPLGQTAKGSAVMRIPKKVVSLVTDKDALYAGFTWPLGFYCIFL